MSKKGRGKRAMEVDGENEEDKRNKMVGFMFGNVDKKGRLDGHSWSLRRPDVTCILVVQCLPYVCQSDLTWQVHH